MSMIFFDVGKNKIDRPQKNYGAGLFTPPTKKMFCSSNPPSTNDNTVDNSTDDSSSSPSTSFVGAVTYLLGTFYGDGGSMT